MLKHRYGLAVEEQNVLPNECAICYSTVALHVDHDHITGLVRGVLCRNHNLGIGYFQDNPTYLLRAAYYLLAHEEETGS